MKLHFKVLRIKIRHAFPLIRIASKRDLLRTRHNVQFSKNVPKKSLMFNNDNDMPYADLKKKFPIMMLASK